jgi:hypothetical protein
MKVQDPKREHPAFDIAPGAWPFYKAQGYTNESEIQKALEQEITVNWSVQRGRFIGDFECPPLITYSTSNGLKGYCESTQGTAHRSVKVFIPGQRPVTCPEHIGQEYLRLFAEWSAKSKKRKPATEKVSAHTTPAKKGEAWQGVTGSPWRSEVELRNK